MIIMSDDNVMLFMVVSSMSMYVCMYEEESSYWTVMSRWDNILVRPGHSGRIGFGSSFSGFG